MSESETISKPFLASEEPSSSFSNKNLIIIILFVLLFFSLIGVNLLNYFGVVLTDILTSLISSLVDLLSLMGFTAGSLINGSADLVAGTTELGIDIAKGTTHSIGDLLIQSGNTEIDPSKQLDLSDTINSWIYRDTKPKPEPAPVQSSEPTVTSISSQKPKAGWCYIGDFTSARGCVQISEHEKCVSGQIFASQSKCLNPAQ